MGLALMIGVFPACGADAIDADSEYDIGASQAALTGSNPLVDADFLAEVTLQAPSAGVSYSDIAVGNGKIYLARSDGRVERRVRDSTAAFETFVTGGGGSYEHLDYVQTGTGWELIGSSNANRKIYRRVQNNGASLGSYPPGVNYVWDVAATEISGGLKLFIIHPDSDNFARLRVGTYVTATSTLTWEGTTRDWGLYKHGLTFRGGNLYSVIDYTTSRFAWISTSTFATSSETGLSPYTEHAYRKASNEAADRFNPRGLAYYSDDRFYGIDEFVSGSSRRWYVARLLRTNLRP